MTQVDLQKLDDQGQGQQPLKFFVRVAVFLLEHRLNLFLDMKGVSGWIQVSQLKKPEKLFSKQ